MEYAASTGAYNVSYSSDSTADNLIYMYIEKYKQMIRSTRDYSHRQQEKINLENAYYLNIIQGAVEDDIVK